MAADASDNKGEDAFDVVLVHDKTADGEGARVLRARPGRLEAGEVRALRSGQPLTPGGEVVRLAQRPGVPDAFDVKVEYQVPAAPEPTGRGTAGPPQIATRAYRESWDRTFPAVGRRDLLN